MKTIVIGGSPCTYWSVIQNNREITLEGMGGKLFNNFVKALNIINPDYFLYENNFSIHQNVKQAISNILGVEGVCINSSLVSAQNRKRMYWFNWEYTPINDRHIFLNDILEYGESSRLKSKTLRCGGRGSKWGDKHEWDMPNPNRRYTLTEMERLQTLPDDYTNIGNNNESMKCLGNGWTAEIIIELLKMAKIPKDDVTVISLYDGMGTGRYCFDKLGYKVIYYAYEIDPYAIKIAKKNYPDIIELGNAFTIGNITKYI